MSAATTILFAREDLSIPGGAEIATPGHDGADKVEAHFFELISRSSPDVIVLDFSHAPAAGTNTIGGGLRFRYWWYAILNNQR
jgi:hypothetical protein